MKIYHTSIFIHEGALKTFFIDILSTNMFPIKAKKKSKSEKISNISKLSNISKN